MTNAAWPGSIDWHTPSGLLLQRLAAALPPDCPRIVTVFGSAPLQAQVAASLMSADVDLFSDEDGLEETVRRAGLDTGEPHIQVGSELNFQTSPRWKDRTRDVRIGNCTFRFPHPMDILIGKLVRLEEKDIRAFQVVYDRTGRPSEAELIAELQHAVDLFRPAFDEAQGASLADNCRRLWPLLYGRQLDPRAEIITPALQRRREGYGVDGTNYVGELREGLRDGGSGPA